MIALAGLTCFLFYKVIILKWYNKMVLIDDEGVLYTTKRMLVNRMGNDNDYNPGF
jgi:hypothetical protein